MQYQHRFVDGQRIVWPLGKIVCVGRNYAEHAKELNNPVPVTPLLFMKPATSAAPLKFPMHLPQQQGPCHFETEIAVLVGDTIHALSADNISDKIAGYGIGLDLTLRALQDELKTKGHPWEMAKAFDGACPLSAFVPASLVSHPESLGLSARINGQLRQQGFVSDMITPIFELLAYISRFFTLQAGDVVMTGTPAGVGPLQPGDALQLSLLLRGDNNNVTTLAEFNASVEL
ncbi:MAG TPA: fumarylacetoacetate hydrolase family protein [Pseudomonadales bacterium]|nr:fumarylacetoacetate hydrolase family protein [Pseudomonadales bacterium]